MSWEKDRHEVKSDFRKGIMQFQSDMVWKASAYV